MSLSKENRDGIIELLEKKHSTTIVLFGKPGSGKTWIARKLSDLATRKGLFDFILWVFLNKTYDEKALYQSIARQLFLFSTTKGLEVDDNLDMEELHEEEKLDVLKLKEKISEALKEKRFLLVLDDEGSKMEEEKVRALLPDTLKNNLKVLITSVNKDGSQNDGGQEELKVDMKTRVPFGVGSLSDEELLSLLRQRAGPKAFGFPEVEALAKDLIKRIMEPPAVIDVDPPAAIVIAAKALSYFCERDSGLRTLKSALNEVFDDKKHNLIHLLCRALDMLPSSILVDFASGGGHFFRNSGSVHYNELIAYWIMEGFLGRIDCVKKAYEEGHRVLMDLIDCRLLKKVEADCIIMEGSAEADHIVRERAMLQVDDCHRLGFDGRANLGLADLSEVDKWGALGRITQADGMIRTLGGVKKGKELSTVLLDGNGPCTEVLNNFCKPNNDLRVLAIFNPTLKSLQGDFTSMRQLSMLVLRGCDFLVKVDQLKELSKLNVLEISGASSLVELPPDLFENMIQLQSLHLSSLKIKSLPDSFYKLAELHRLLIKDCPNLAELRALAKCDNLVVLNLSGCIALERFHYKSLAQMQKLRTLDLSGTLIKNLPIFGTINELTHISLRNCPKVERLPSIVKLTHLQVLDISGSKAFVEIQDESFQANAALNFIDLSDTGVQKLPSNINTHRLYLKGCLDLEELPFMDALEDLEALDLSGSRELKINEKFFQNLNKLRFLNLSDTNIERLPHLSHHSELRQLLLSKCPSLKELPQLENLKKLEVLDLSGCCRLNNIPTKSFAHMTCLQRLILSGTQIESLPSLSDLINLRVLLLDKCTKLEGLLEFPSNLEELNLCSVASVGKTGAKFLRNMGQLRILDLSETNLNQLPSMSNVRNLTQLFLSNCNDLKEVPDLEALTELEVLDLSGTALSCQPSLSKFPNLHQLLPDLSCLDMPALSGAIIKQLSDDFFERTHLEQLAELNRMNNPGVQQIDQLNRMINPGADSEEINFQKEEMSQFPVSDERSVDPVSVEELYSAPCL